VIQKKVENYYNRNFFSYPSSYSAYRMVRDLKKANNDYLWYAIVGMTSMFLDHKISKEMLDNLSEVYKLDMMRFNPQSAKKDKGEIYSRKGYQFTLMDHWSLYESMVNSNYLMTKLHLWEDKGINRLH
jgi:cell division control protein 45